MLRTLGDTQLIQPTFSTATVYKSNAEQSTSIPAQDLH